MHEKKLEIIDLYEDDNKNKNPVKVMKNKSAHNWNLVQSFRNIIDVLGDSNCGFYAIEALLKLLRKVDVGVSVTSIRKTIFDYIDKNMNTMLSNINISFRDTVLRDYRVKRYFELEKSRIYADERDYENRCRYEGWI